MLGYTYDRESGEFTVYHLKRFLRGIASCPQLERLHIVGHSRGADILLTALRDLHLQYAASGQDTRQQLKHCNVVLAAADLDWQVAVQRIAAERLTGVCQRTTIYLNQNDRAIELTEWLFPSITRLGQLRLGDLTPSQRAALSCMEGLNLIDVRVKTDFLDHAYFTSNPAVLSDLILLLRDNRAPGIAHGRPLIDLGGGFWELRTGYPQLDGPAVSAAASWSRSDQ